MEWVETTGRSLEEAKEAALDQLGVDSEDAEFEVLEEPRRGFLGWRGGEARVRARVRPATPRAKEERRERRRRGRERAGPGRSESATEAAVSVNEVGDSGVGTDVDEVSQGVAVEGRMAVSEQSSATEQGEVASSFVNGLVDAFGVEATVSAIASDEDTIEVRVSGDDLGLLIGPRGQTLSAIQELTRTVLQRRVSGRTCRLYVDIAGYRQKRREALSRFTRQVAEEVAATGVRKVLEPMSPPDRKVVHDTVNEIAGVITTSEGEEPRRRVVILPEDEAR